MDRLEEDSWWMNLLKEKPKRKTPREDLCGADACLSTGMGRDASPPDSSGELRFREWWMNMIFRRHDSAEDSRVEDSANAEQRGNIEDVLGQHSSTVAPGGSNSAAVFSGTRPCGAAAAAADDDDDDYMFAMLYDKVRPVKPTKCHHRTSLKSVKKTKHIPFECPSRKPKDTAL